MDTETKCEGLEKALESQREKGADALIRLDNVLVTYRPTCERGAHRHVLLEFEVAASHCTAVESAMAAVIAARRVVSNKALGLTTQERRNRLEALLDAWTWDGNPRDENAALASHLVSGLDQLEAGH